MGEQPMSYTEACHDFHGDLAHTAQSLGIHREQQALVDCARLVNN